MAKNNETLGTDNTSKYSELSQNPFTDGWELRLVHRSESIPTKGYGKLSFSRDIDFSKSTLYGDFFTPELVRQYSELSKSSLYLLFYALGHLRWNQDYLQLTYKVTGMSKPTFYRAIKDLADLQIIASRVGSRETYWINPRKIFHGSRVEVYHKYVSTSTSTSEVDEQINSDIEKYTK